MMIIANGQAIEYIVFLAVLMNNNSETNSHYNCCCANFGFSELELLAQLQELFAERRRLQRELVRMQQQSVIVTARCVVCRGLREIRAAANRAIHIFDELSPFFRHFIS